MLDIPLLFGVDVLAPGTAITADDLSRACDRQGIEVGAGDAVLIRSGWPKHWDDPDTFVGLTGGAPGPDESAAMWLADRKVRVSGAETIAFECIYPGKGHALLPVHRILLVENGIYIIEVLNLTELAAENVFEFLFVLTPLKMIGGTGSPVRPIAVVS
jgi:kynurenine formamidase